MSRATQPHLITAEDPEAEACTLGGVEHDYRPVTDPDAWGPKKPKTYLRCVWCHAVACGDHNQPDPCIEPYHHRVVHRSRAGVTWPIGGVRP